MMKSLKLGTIVCSLLLTASMLISCASSSAASSTSTSESNATSPSTSTAETTVPSTSETEKARGSLVIYTNSGSDGRAEWLTEKAKENGFDIAVVQIAGGDLSNRIIAEKNTQLADVVFGLNTMEFSRLKNEEVLMAYTPTWSEKIDTSLGDIEGFYSPIVIQPLFLAYNTDFIDTSNAPKDWIELGQKAEYSGKYTLLGLGGGTAKSIIASILVRYLDDTGEYGVSQEGWDIMKAFIQNGQVPPDGEDWFGKCLDGSRPMTMMWGSGLLQRINEMSLTNMDFMVPDVGVPYVVEQIAVFKNSKNIELAKEFVEWFGSAEVQADWSKQFGTIPVQPDALATAGEDVQQMMAKVHKQDIDWSIVSSNIEQWMEKIQLEFVK